MEFLKNITTSLTVTCVYLYVSYNVSAVIIFKRLQILHRKLNLKAANFY